MPMGDKGVNMQRARVIGNYIQQLSNEKHITNVELSKILGCKEYQVKALMQGRMILGFEQLTKLAKTFNVTVSDLIHGNAEQYNEHIYSCVGEFSDINNMNTVFDLIDEYLDVLDATVCD